MGQNLMQGVVITPTSNVVTNVYTGWVSSPLHIQGVEHGAEEVNLLLDIAWGTATQIDLLVEHATRDDPTTYYPAGKIDSSDEVVPDVVILKPGNMLASPSKIDLSFRVPAMSAMRLTAKATNPSGATTLDAKLSAGGGWRGA